MKPNYRSMARNARDRAVQELAAAPDARVRYAALELRTAMEALVYERVLLFEAELPENELGIWQPRRVFEVLLELDPYVDQSSSIAVAPESSPGVTSGPFRHVGNERVISTKELKEHYDRLGSYLHAPTVQQMRGSTITPEKMRTRCQEVLEVIDQVLSSRIFAVDFKVTAKMPCTECNTTVVCRMPKNPDESRTVNCTRCKASYLVQPAEKLEVTWKPLQEILQCKGPDCTGSCVVWRREIEPGVYWVCESCGGKNRLAIGISYSPPERGAATGKDKSVG